MYCTCKLKQCSCTNDENNTRLIIHEHVMSRHETFKSHITAISILRTGFHQFASLWQINLRQNIDMNRSLLNKLPCMNMLLTKHMHFCIRKTCPCSEYPRKPHFYIVKLRYAGVYLFFLFLLQNIDCGYSLEPPRRGGSNLYPQSMF